ncbi:MAG: TIR domain-containing protein [Umezawaea sp.]
MGYDVFLSYSGDDRPVVRELRDALEKVGVRTFLDEHDIRFAHSITGDIEWALRTSKTMLAYYSKSFPGRSACQFELHHAYLSALRAGEVEQRILVVNPEDPDTDHLMPLELAAHRYFKTWGTKSELAALVAEVKAKVRAVDTTFTGIDFAERATTRQTSPEEPTAAYVGRYRDRWAIHSALHRDDHPLVNPVTSQPVAALTGITGIGKSALAKVYVHDFGFLYRGGVHRIALTGRTADEVRATHTAQLVELAGTLGAALPDRSRATVLAWWNARLAGGDRPALWIVDDVPDHLPLDLLAELVPCANGVRTLVIGQREFPAELAKPVRLNGMTPDDGSELFTRDHQATDAEARAIDDIVAGLGGHPLAILFAAAASRGREGLWRLDERVDHLTSDATVLDRALLTVRRAIGGLSKPESAVLGLSAVCGPDPLPARLIAEVLTAFTGTADVSGVLAGMDRAMLISMVEGSASWQVHQLVRQAARQSLPEGDLNTIAAIAAHQVITSAGVNAEHAAALLDRTAGSPVYAMGLNLVAAHDYDRRGEPALSAPFHENLHSLRPNEVDHLVMAAEQRLAAGHLELAAAHADNLAGTAADAFTTLRTSCVRAGVLDARGRHREAEAIWAAVVADPVLRTTPRTEQIAIRTAHIRNHRSLGHFTVAKGLIEDLLHEFDDPGSTEALIPARLELAAVGLAGDDRHGARKTAQEVVEHYEQRGLPSHANAIEAATIYYEGQFEVYLLEKFPTEEDWSNAEVKLRELVATARLTFGPTNPRTLRIAVAHLRALVGRGAPSKVVEEYSHLPEELAEHLGADHRLHLRALFLLGQALGQQCEYEAASKFYRRALAGQEASLGRAHPETLRTRYELGVEQLTLGDRQAGRDAMHAVLRDVGQEVGWRNDLHSQARVVLALSTFLPAAAWRAVSRLDDRRKR